MKLKIALAQIRCEKGDWTGNLRRVEELMAQASKQGCNVIVFPEMGLSGYCNPTLFPDAVQALDSPLVRQFVDLTARYPIAASGGFIEAKPEGKPYITQLLAKGGRIVGTYRKVNVVEEEAELFSPGSDTPVFQLPLREGDITCALAVCADSDRPDIFESFTQRGARIVFHSSAPGLYTRRTDEAAWQAGFDWYKSHLAERLPVWAKSNNLAIAVATQCGATVDEDFPGGSFVFDQGGTCLASTTGYEEALLVCDLEIPD